MALATPHLSHPPSQGVNKRHAVRPMQLSFIETPSSRTPLTYIGGKSVIYNRVMDLLPDGTDLLVSPFSGAAGLELKIAASGIQVRCHDIHPPNAHLFTLFNGESDKVVEAAKRLYPLSREDFIRYGSGQGEEWSAIECPYERAAVYWMASKQGYGGRNFTSTPATSPSNIGRREYFDHPDWRGWRNRNFTYREQCWRDTLAEYPDAVLYCDPPYVEKESFYGWKGGQPIFPHEEFRDAMGARTAFWMISYAPHPVVEDLYADFNIIRMQWTNMVSGRGGRQSKMDELLITNSDDWGSR